MSKKVINVGEIDISGENPEEVLDKEAKPELSPEELARRQRLARLFMAQVTKRNGNWKRSLKGFPSYGKVKETKFWYKGKLISKEEHDKLSTTEIQASNNVVKVYKKETL